MLVVIGKNEFVGEVFGFWDEKAADTHAEF